MDSILYLDTDMVLLEDVGALWAQLAMLQVNVGWPAVRTSPRQAVVLQTNL